VSKKFLGRGTVNNNRIDGYSYDASGDLLNDGSHQYTYDAENRVWQVDGGATATYVYDANGRRVRKTTASGGSVDYLYDLAGNVITELGPAGAWNRGEIYAGGHHLATYSLATTFFIHADWLGTERVRSSVAGAVYETCASLPFGDGLGCSTADTSPLHFTGKEHDWESGLDNFGARYDASSLGRFMSPDAGAFHWGNPQSLNRYIYTLDNPLRFVDPDGLDPREASNWERFKAAVKSIFIVKGEVGAGVGAAGRAGPFAAKAEAKLSGSLALEGGDVQAQVAVKADAVVGISNNMVGPQLTVPILTANQDGTQLGGKPSIGLTSTERTGRDHGTQSEASQGVDSTGSIPITVAGHAGAFGGEVGIDLAAVGQAAQTGTAALLDSLNALASQAFQANGMNPSSQVPVPQNPSQPPQCPSGVVSCTK